MDRRGYEDRPYAASMAQRYIKGSLTLEAFVEIFATTSDPLIEELLDLIIHEPKHGGLFGVSEGQYQKYKASVGAVLSELEKGTHGSLPTKTPVKLKWLALSWGLLLPFILASAAEHVVKIVGHVRGSERLAVWELILESIGAVFMLTFSIVLFRALVYGTRRYKAQRRRRAI